MILSDFHVHTCYSDGKNTPEEVVRAAIEMGIGSLGISDHCYFEYDECCGIKKDKVEEYRDEILALKERYKGKIKLYLGIEQEIYCGEPREKYDYVIGSVHYLKTCDGYVPIDCTAEELKGARDRFFGGDIYALTAAYFEAVASVVEQTKCDVIGHLDLITKFQEREVLFDESDPRYIAQYKGAIDRLLPYKTPFEINTGAISRGYRSTPYPSLSMIEYIKSKGGKLILSSDSHSCDTLCYGFEKWQDLI